MWFKVVLLITISWVLSTHPMQEDLQKKLIFRKVAEHLGFNGDTLELHFNPTGKIMFAVQDVEKGWILLKTKDQKYKITSCAADHGVIKNGYYQTEWLTLKEALEYVPHMQEK